MPKRSVRNKVSLSFSKKKRSSSSIFWFLILFILLPVIVWAVYQQTQVRSKAVSSQETIFGKSIEFNNDGFNDTYATVKPSITLSQNPFTVEAWVKVKKPSSGDYLRSYPIIMYTKPQTWVDSGYIFKLDLEVQESNGMTRPIFYALLANSTSNINSNYITVTPSQSLNPDVWYHIAASSYSKGDFCTVKLYINGVSTGERTMYRQNCQISILQPQELRLAKFQENVSPKYNFTGETDEVRISNIIRYTSDFTPVKLPFPDADPQTLLLYHFNEVQNVTLIKDSSPNHNDAAITGTHYQFVPSTIIDLPTPTPTPVLLPDVRVNGMSKDETKRELRVDVCNDGPVGISQPFNVQLVWQDKTHAFTTESYAPKSCVPVTLSCQGWHNVCLWPSVIATADSDNSVSESNENNNSLTVPFPNRAPEVVIGELREGKKGKQYDENIGGFDWDLGDVLSLATTPLPKGLSLANCKQSEELYEGKPSYNCAITGKPKKSGKSSFTVTIKDNRGGIGQGKGTIVIK